MGCLGDEPGVDAVDGRQVHGIEDGRQVALELGAIDRAHDVARTIALGDRGGERRLVDGQALEFGEGERHGRHRLRPQGRHGAEQRA